MTDLSQVRALLARLASSSELKGYYDRAHEDCEACLRDHNKYDRQSQRYAEQTVEIADQIIALLPSPLPTGGWIVFNGNERPVAINQRVAVKFRNGSTDAGRIAGAWDWRNDGANGSWEIIAYRIISDTPSTGEDELAVLKEVRDDLRRIEEMAPAIQEYSALSHACSYASEALTKLTTLIHKREQTNG